MAMKDKQEDGTYMAIHPDELDGENYDGARDTLAGQQP